jgi:hypothetical protein
LLRRGPWARLVASAGAVTFTRRDAGEPNLWAFSTPDWTITVPNGGRGTNEHQASFNNHLLLAASPHKLSTS